MSRARCNRAAIRKDLFSPQNLADEESIRCTLQEFQATLKPDNLDTVIEAVISLQSGQILALIITCIQKDCILLPWLLDMFPTTIDSFSSSLHNSILFYLASYMPEIEEASLPTSEQHKLVINFSAILGCLSKISFQDDTSRKKSRKGRKAVELSDHEIVLLRSMGISVPNSPSQRDAIHRKLLSQAKDVMQNYIACLRSGRAEKEVLGSFLNTGGLAHDSGGYDNVSLNHHLSAHFAAVQGFGQWRLLVSTQAEQDLRTMFQKESKSFQEVMEKLKQLSHGFFSEHDRRVLYGANISVPIYQVRVLHYWVIFQVDCMVDSERQSVIQALKIYGCYTYDKLQHEGFCKAVEYHLRQKGKVYEARCKARKVASSFGNEVSRYVPITFTILETPSECDEEATVDPLPPDDVNQLELLKVFSRIYPFSQGLMHALKDDLPVRLLLQLSPKEQEIVRHPYSVYVIGRSGTGKTLVMLQKMLLIEKASKELSAEYRRPRQVFVTKSRLLALQVAAEFHQSAVALGIYSSSERTDAHQDEFSSMIDYNDETFDHYASTLTSGFDGLEDKDFPLFTSFADLCSLVLEAAKTHRKYAEKYKAFKKKPLISAIDFHHKYWPRFSDNLKRGLSPTTVFSEILGKPMPL
ncbi:hypothetical protein AX16_000585 [Volvariella volvacea WC 439]|nr:hypothetical protein AX16_000585 [Volvariella volvacea WC 439]